MSADKILCLKSVFFLIFRNICKLYLAMPSVTDASSNIRISTLLYSNHKTIYFSLNAHLHRQQSNENRQRR